MATATSYSTAVITTGGKQYLVSVGAEISVEKLDATVGETVSLQPVFAGSGEKIAAAKDVAGVKVHAEVLEHGRGEKIRVFKFKSKKRYRRTQGHRQSFTRLKITAIA